MKYWPRWLLVTLLVVCLLTGVVLVYGATRQEFQACVGSCVSARGDAFLGRCQAGCFLR